MIELVLRTEAQQDLEEARSWYDAQESGVGAEFLEEVDRCLTRIHLSPDSFAPVHRDCRRVALHRFPYVVYFQLHPHRIEVVAIIHMSRHSSLWRRRIR